MKARIFKVKNRDRKFGSALDYTAIVLENGKRLLITADAWNDAEKRANANSEDFKRPSIWQKVFGR